MALKTRDDLIAEAAANLGIIQQADTSATRTRADLASEAAACLGLNQQTYTGAARTRADLLSETYSKFGYSYQADSAATRTRADWVTETLHNLGSVYGPSDEASVSTRADLIAAVMGYLGAPFKADSSATRTRADWTDEILSLLGVVQQPDSGATVTRAALVNNAAFILGAAEVGNALDAEDYAAIDARVDTVIDDLNARVIATISNANAIPGAWFDALSIILANVCKDQYGVTGDEATRLQTEAAAAEERLKTLNRTGLVNEALPSLVGDLNARNVATVSNIEAIPGAWFTSLAEIGAEYFKGKFGTDAARSQEITARAALAERKLKIMTRSALVDDRVDTVASDLILRMIVPLVLPIDNVQDQWLEPLAVIIANAVKDEFDLDPALPARLITAAQEAERNLKISARGPIIDEILPDIVGDLNARRIATVSDITAIPGAWLPALADIAAEQVKGKFDVTPDRSQQLATRAATAERKLKIITQAPLLDEKIPSILGELSARQIVTVADPDSIPTQFFPALASIVADSTKNRFDLPADVMARLSVEAKEAERTLLTLNAVPLIDEKIPQILGNLNARMIATVSNSAAISGAWFEPLADIVAEACQARFELPADIRARVSRRAADAERILKNLTRLPVIDRNIDPIIADLMARNIIYLVDPSVIPDEWFLHVAAIVADRCKGKGFDLDPATLARVADDGRRAIGELREMTSGGPSYLPQTTAYF